MNLRNGRSLLRSFRFWRLVIIGVALALVARLFIFGVYEVASDSMSPTLKTHQRVLVWKWTRFMAVHRGDVVVFDGTDSFVQGTSTFSIEELLGIRQLDTNLFVKRVIGIGGDSVKCCDSDGYLLLNGERIIEPYLTLGMSPSEVEFDVVVPDNTVWVMGDNRAVSQDSRSLLGRPGGGMISVDKIVGRVAYSL